MGAGVVYVGFDLVKAFSPPIRVGPGLGSSFDVQSSSRLPAFNSIELMLYIRADLRLLMTSGGGEKQDGGHDITCGNRSAALGAAEVSPSERLAARVLAEGLVPITKHAFSEMPSGNS